MNLLPRAVAALTIAATVFVPMATSSAFANESGFMHDSNGGYIECRPYHRHCGGRGNLPYLGPRPSHHRGGMSGGDVAGMAILGILGGALIDNALNKRQRSRNGPRIITTHEGSLQPWSHNWYNYCENRYRSFNPRTGTYRGYDGENHFCVAQ